MIEKIAIFGGGNTGLGLAKSMALAGLEITVVEKSKAQAQAQASRADLEARLDAEIEKFGITPSEKNLILTRSTFTPDAQDAAEAGLFLEAVPETVSVKRRVLHEMERIEPEGSPRIKLVNCAAIEVSDLQDGLIHPESVLGFYVLPPADTTPLVELVRGRRTSDEAHRVACKLARRLGKECVTVTEYPGSITTRILVPFLNEAFHALMEGVADAEDIDRAMKSALGLTQGPLRAADSYGLDQVLRWAETLHRELGDPKFLPCPLLRRYVRAGRYGVKTGRGVYTYPSRKSS